MDFVVPKDAFVLVSTPVGQKFHLTAMVGQERLGRPFQYDIELMTGHDDVDPLKLLGNQVTLELELEKGKRFFNGLVSEIASLGRDENYSYFRATLRPWLWFLTRSSDNKIFQNLDAVAIIKQVFKDNKFSDFKSDLTGNYRKREYCVQYGESSFDFVSRLMEEEGIYYYFSHSKGKHELVLVDSPSAHQDVDGKSIRFRGLESGVMDSDFISSWAWSRQVQTQKFTLESYDFKNPKAELKAERKAPDPQSELGKHGQSGRERYEYGQLYPVKADGDSLAAVRAEEQVSEFALVNGDGNARVMASGYKFKLSDHPVKNQDDEYLIVDARYDIQNTPLSTNSGSGEASYSCGFTALNAKTQFRSARITPKALVRGPQTAVVVGPENQEISTDEFGRVKVQFHWDRDGKKNQDSSCFVRVAQAWAGGGWGAFSLPRHGQEVIVDFLEGDPDQPIITGSVYNADNKVPFALPKNQTQSGLRTRSTPKGDTKTFNELRFEDKKDSEEIYLHAERDFTRIVENNDTLIVGNQSKETEGHGYKGQGNQTITIYNNRTATLEEGNDALTIKNGNRTATLENGNDTLSMAKGNRTATLENGNDALTLKGGSQKIDVSEKIDIEAGDQLKITVGQSSLTMKKDGSIILKGKDIKISGTGDVTIKAAKNVKIQGGMGVDIKGLKVAVAADTNAQVKGGANLDLSGGAMAKLKGGVTMIG